MHFGNAVYMYIGLSSSNTLELQSTCIWVLLPSQRRHSKICS